MNKGVTNIHKGGNQIDDLSKRFVEKDLFFFFRRFTRSLQTTIKRVEVKLKLVESELSSMTRPFSQRDL